MSENEQELRHETVACHWCDGVIGRRMTFEETRSEEFNTVLMAHMAVCLKRPASLPPVVLEERHPQLTWDFEDGDYFVSLAGVPNSALTAYGSTKRLALHTLGEAMFIAFEDDCEDCLADRTHPDAVIAVAKSNERSTSQVRADDSSSLPEPSSVSPPDQGWPPGLLGDLETLAANCEESARLFRLVVSVSYAADQQERWAASVRAAIAALVARPPDQGWQDMLVYLVDGGDYENYGWDSVYASLDAALAAHPVAEAVDPYFIGRTGGWQPVSRPRLPDGEWWNGLKGDFGKHIHAVPLRPAPPEVKE